MKKTKPVLILQLRPEDETADNEYGAILKYGNLKSKNTVRVRAEKQGIPAIDLENYSAIIVGGSPFDISAPSDKKSLLQSQIEADFVRLFDQVVPEDFPFLGACSGNGLLGSYLGASISTRFSEPVGGATILITDDGKCDPLLSGFPDSIRVLLGHKEACDDLPPNATLLAQGSECPIQMFKVGENVYATQFHPEADGAGFEVRINVYRNHGYFNRHEVNKLTNAVKAEHTPYAQKILARFVERYTT